MIRAIASLAAHRLRRRASAALLLVGAVAAATGVGGTIAALGGSAADEGIARALAALPPPERALRVTGYAPSSEGAAALDASARASLGGARSIAGESMAGTILRRVRDPRAPYDLQLVAVDDAQRWLSLASGSVPRPCDGTSCEAVLLSRRDAPPDLPATLHIGSLEVRLVGRATLSSEIPLGSLDERGPELPPADPYSQTTDAPPALLLVDGVAAAARAEGSAAVGRTYLWTAPLDTAVVHPWTVANVRSTIDAARASLAAAAPSLSLAAPTETIDDVLARASANGARLLLVGSLAAAILVAFAAYAALLGRRDLQHELERLAAMGAGRRAAVLLVALESGVPTLAGGALGWLAALAAAAVVAPGAGGDRTAVAVHVLAAPPTLGLLALIVGAALVAAVLGLVGRAGRGALGGLLPGLAVAGVLVAWRASDGFDVGSLASGVEAPFVALLPALVGLAVASVALVVMPHILRRAARAGRRAPLPVRLALLSVARDATRPAATVTLLAFGLGGLIFAVADAATLDRGISDQMGFRTAMDLRVVEAGTDLTLDATVVPFDRYRSLGPGVHAWPTLHLEAMAGGSIATSVLGLPPDAVAGLRGWRSDDAADSPIALARAIEVPGPFAVPGHRLPPGEAKLVLPVTASGDWVDLSAVIETDAGDAVRVYLGTAIRGSQTLTAGLPARAIGGRIVAIVVAEGRLIAGQDHPAKLGRATLRLPSLDDFLPARPLEVQVSGLDKAVLRAPLPTDGLALPAIVSPDLAALAATTPDRTLSLTIGDGPLVRIRVAGVAARFPTIADEGRGFAVVALDPLLTALDGASPGAGHPDEAWIRVDPPATVSSTIAALRSPTFRSPAIVDRAALEAAAREDPFATSISAAFAAAGLAGMLLAALGLLLGAAADLRDEAGELRDLEAQGLGPTALRRQVAVRAAVLGAAGVAAGLLVGLVLSAWVTSSIAVSANVGRPVPPLALVVPWERVALAVVVPLVGTAAIGWLLSRWSFRRSARAASGRPSATPARPRTEEAS